MLIEICRFWESKAKLNPKTKRYSIDKVMGPDEFHEMYPNAKEGGLRDNAYTNVMTIWMFEKTISVIKSLGETKKDLLYKKLNFSENEIEHWKKIAKKLKPCQKNAIEKKIAVHGFVNRNWYAISSIYSTKIQTKLSIINKCLNC